MDKVSRNILIKVAYMYYKSNLNQNEIAKRLNLERSTISKYLKKAREQNIIKIYIENEYIGKLENDLETILGVRQVSIVHKDDSYRNVGEVAGEFLQRSIKNGMVVGFNWGRSMYAVVKYITETKNSKVDAVFIPIVGGANSDDNRMHGNALCFSLANAFQGKSYSLYSPVLVENEEAKLLLSKTSACSKIFELWENIDIAFIGIGAINSSSNVIWNDNLKQEDIKVNYGNNIVGETCTRFYDELGNEVVTNLTDRTISIELDKLKQAKEIVGVAVGVEKANAIIAAAKGKMLTRLFTDEITAQEIYKICKKG